MQYFHTSSMLMVIINGKKQHYAGLFDSYKHDIVKTWRVLKTIMRKDVVNKTLPEYFNVNGTKLTKPDDIANAFCTYYTDVGASLASKIIPPNRSFDTYLTNRSRNSMFLTPTDPMEIVDIMNKLKSKKVLDLTIFPLSAQWKKEQSLKV